MRHIVISVLLAFFFQINSDAQSKIFFEDAEPELIVDIADGALLTTVDIIMKNEHTDTIEVAWQFTLDIPRQENPDNENMMENIWIVLLCDEILCHSESSAITVIPPKESYTWKFNVTAEGWLGYEWVLGEGKVNFTAANTLDESDAASFTANLKVIENGGCLDNTACNYDEMAAVDDNSCTYSTDSCVDEDGNEGVYADDCTCKQACADENACNQGEGADCLFVDCAGECGGSATAGSTCTDINGNESVYDEYCTCVEVVSVEFFDILSKSIFPNPTTGIVHLEFKDANHTIEKMTVSNLIGQEVMQVNQLQTKRTYQLDITHLPKGLYQINLFNNKNELLYSEKIKRQ